MSSVYEPLDHELEGAMPESARDFQAAEATGLPEARKACLSRRRALLLASAGVLGLLAVGAARRVARPDGAGADVRGVLVLQEAPPCSLADETGVLLAMNPCKAPIDEIQQELGSDVAELLAELKVSEKVAARPWKVVAPGWVDVVQEKGGKAIRAEPHCSVLDGIREGGWLRLTNNHGYMEILHKGVVWLQPNETSYTRITNGTCADNFLFPILEEVECERAAGELEIFDTSVDVDGEATPIPPGCYVTTMGSLRISYGNGQESYGEIAGKWRDYLRQPMASKQVFEVICSSTDRQMLTCDARHNTTSTTTLTTSATPDIKVLLSSLPDVSRGPAGLPSLYCFSMTRALGYEPGLVITQYAKGASIFGCDEYQVFSQGGIVSFGDFDSVEIKVADSVMGDPSKPGVTTASFLNTVAFMQVWDEVIKEGKFLFHDWVVKVDPDAVFFPERLRDRLAQYTPTAKLENPAVYFVNCDITYGPLDTLPFGKVFGSLEIYSRNALAEYGIGGERECKKMPWQGWGEDFYMQKCMEMLGVTHIQDFTMVGDKRCHFAPCTDKTRVSFHDWKNIPSYFDCWGQSLGAKGVAEYEAKQSLKRLQK